MSVSKEGLLKLQFYDFKQQQNHLFLRNTAQETGSLIY